MAANPVQGQPLRLGEECRTIEDVIRKSRFRDRIRVRSRWAARPEDLLQALNEDRPSILHFSGHGAGAQGLCFQADDGSAASVSGGALQRIVQAAGASVTVVFLNACFSEVQARALVACVPCVIGMPDVIGDLAAIAYARAFYSALGFGHSVANAHDQGQAALAVCHAEGRTRDILPMEGTPCRPSPVLLTRDGIDAARIYVVGGSTDKRRCEIRIRATLDEFNADVIARVTEELREITGDLSLEIVALKEGSVRLTVTLSPAAMEQLLRLRASGKLNEISGFAVFDVLELSAEEESEYRSSLTLVRERPRAVRNVEVVSAVAFENLASTAIGGGSKVRDTFLSGLENAPAKRHPPEDEMPLALLAKGDRRGAITAMIEAHEEIVFAYCVRALRDRKLAEDVTQQVFLEAHRDMGRFRGEASMKTWLIGVARHRCADAIKARARRASMIELDMDGIEDEDNVDPATAPSEHLERSQLVAALEGCLAELSPEIRETVELRFLFGMTYEEMAVLLGRKADTLCVRVARALPLLKRCLEMKGLKPR